MVTTEASQLSQECNTWRQALRSYRDEFQRLKSDLQQQALRRQFKEDLLQVDHFDNQFFIQLVNIHDLKQSIKNHDRALQLEQSASGNRPISQPVMDQHERLTEAFRSLQTTLHYLHEDFDQFCAKA